MIVKEPKIGNIKKWVEALRSGEYKQTDGALRRYGPDDEESYCCLGVACDLAKEDLEGYDWINNMEFGTNDGEDVSDTRLPEGVSNWLGIANSDPTLIGKDDFRKSAVSFNDTYRYTFEEIADAIERTYLNA